jgi:hypothetical protein
MMNFNTNENLPIACDLTAIPVAVRQEHFAAVPIIFQAVQEVKELTNGYTFRFANEPGMFMALAHFVENERRCCSFFGFALEIEPGGGPLWLRLTGGEGVKEFQTTTFGDLHEAVRNQLIRTDPDHNLDEVVDRAAPILAGIFGKDSFVQTDREEGGRA